MLSRYSLSRRTFMVSAAAAAASVSACAPGGESAKEKKLDITGPINPVVKQRADAQIFRHGDGNYYMTASVPEYDRLIIRRASTIAGLATAPETVVWRRPAQGKLGGYIWAPELHEIDGRWYIYFAAGDSSDPFHIRTYVLQGPSGDPFKGDWSILGQLETPWDSFNLDSTVFTHRGTRYICWAQREPGIETNSNLYLAPLKTPTTLGAAPVRLTVPTLPWEIQGFKVNEAPALLHRNGRLFLTYSASATDARYCLGLLTADENADLMLATSWTKSEMPVFVSSDITKVYGPGHNSFTVDEQGRDVLVYHGRDYEKIEGDPLFDPNRHTRVQRLYYRADGTPDFGIPVGNGELPDRLSPVGRQDTWLRHEGSRIVAGRGPLPSTQFRQKPGLSGQGTVSLEPVTAPGQYVSVAGNGELVLASNDGSPSFAERSSFRRVEGLADPRGFSFAALSGTDVYLSHVGNDVRVEAVRNNAERQSATFLVS